MLCLKHPLSYWTAYYVRILLQSWRCLIKKSKWLNVESSTYTNARICVDHSRSWSGETEDPLILITKFPQIRERNYGYWFGTVGKSVAPGTCTFVSDGIDIWHGGGSSTLSLFTSKLPVRCIDPATPGAGALPHTPPRPGTTKYENNYIM